MNTVIDPRPRSRQLPRISRIDAPRSSVRFRAGRGLELTDVELRPADGERARAGAGRHRTAARHYEAALSGAVKQMLRESHERDARASAPHPAGLPATTDRPIAPVVRCPLTLAATRITNRNPRSDVRTRPRSNWQRKV